MGHGIQQTDAHGELDKVVLHREQAWHGLGTLVDRDLGPREGVIMANMPERVEGLRIVAKLPDGTELPISDTVANVRFDQVNGEEVARYMACVNAGYVPIQREEMADFCEALVDSSKGKVFCESVGSIKGGRQVWILLKGEAFEVANGDQTFKYICVSNSHDGSQAFRITPTGIRVVCDNTLRAVVPYYDNQGEMQLGKSALALRHTVNIMERVQQAQDALKHYDKVMAKQKELAEGLVRVDVTQEKVRQFFMDCYTADFGEVPMDPQDAKETRRRERALDAMSLFSRRFDDEREVAGSNMWNAFNAYSGLVQHDKKARGKNDPDRVQKRVHSNLFGLNSDRTERAFKRALATAT